MQPISYLTHHLRCRGCHQNFYGKPKQRFCSQKCYNENRSKIPKKIRYPASYNHLQKKYAFIIRVKVRRILKQIKRIKKAARFQSHEEYMRHNNRRLINSGGPHPNKFELRVMDFLNRRFPNRFTYCGDGSVFIGGHSPDFIDEATKTVVLANGEYWHLRRSFLDVSDSNKRIVEKEEADAFLKEGYKVYFIWDDEFKKSAPIHILRPQP